MVVLALGIWAEILGREHVDLHTAFHECVAGAHERYVLKLEAGGNEQLRDPADWVWTRTSVTQGIAVETGSPELAPALDRV